MLTSCNFYVPQVNTQSSMAAFIPPAAVAAAAKPAMVTLQTAVRAGGSLGSRDL
jgi:hypothetical protein